MPDLTRPPARLVAAIWVAAVMVAGLVAPTAWAAAGPDTSSPRFTTEGPPARGSAPRSVHPSRGQKALTPPHRAASTAGPVTVDVVEADVEDDLHGTMTVTYVITVASTSESAIEYELAKQLAFGDGITVVSTAVTGEVDGDVDEGLVDPAWDGSTHTALTNGARTLPGGAEALLTVSAVVELTDVLSARAADCRLQPGESGTGFRSTVEVTSGSATASVAACVRVPLPDLRVSTKVSSRPTRGSNGAVTIGYDLTVTNRGRSSTVYDLRDRLRFASDAYVLDVDVTNLSPGGIETNPRFDGRYDLAVASAPLAAGASHRYRLVVTTIDSQTARAAADRGGSLDGVRNPDLGDDSSALSDMFLALGKGAAGQVGGAAAGWAMSAMGISTEDSGAQQELTSQLQEVIDELSNIDTELGDIDSDIQKMDCDEEVTATNQTTGYITEQLDKYNTFLADGQAGQPDLGGMTTWAQQIVNGSGSVEDLGTQLAQLAAQIDPGGGGQGTIGACLQAGVTPIPESGSWGDNDYYQDKVGAITGWYYAAQVHGLLLWQEANLYLAQQHYDAVGGPALGLDDTQQICVQTFNGQGELEYYDATIGTYCRSVISQTNQLYEDLATQMEVGGASYDHGNVLSIQYDGDTARLVTKSLESLTQAAGDSCPTPLTSADPCGITVGNQATAGTSNAMKVTYGGYTGWRPATWNEFNFLWGFDLTEEPSAFLAGLGIQNPDDKVVLTSTTYGWNPEDYQGSTRTATKFVDTSFGVFGSSENTQGLLYEETSQCPGGAKSTLYTPDRQFMQTERNGWYDFDFRKCGLDTGEWNVDPGWFAAYPDRAIAQQYRWPMLSVPSLSCTNGRQPKNAGGAWTRCGADFDAWFDNQVPRPDSCAPSSTWGECGPTPDSLGAALDAKPLPPTDPTYDCRLRAGEDGTGLLGVATASHSQGKASDDACARTPLRWRSSGRPAAATETHHPTP